MDVTRRDVLIGTTMGLAGGLSASRRNAGVAADYKLTLTFMGFGALVVDAMDAKTARPAARTTKAHMLAVSNLDHPRHYTRLRVYKKFLKTPSTSASNFMEWNIRDYELTVVDTLDPTGVSVSTSASPLPICPSTAEWKNVDLLGNLGRAGETLGRVEPTCLEMNPPGVVGARITLSTGEVHALAPMAGYEQQQWEMRYPDATAVPNAGVRTIAETTQATMRVGAGAALQLTPFLGSPGEPMRIDLVCPPGETDLAVTVTNHAGVEHGVAGPAKVEHFKWYYDLLCARDQPKKGRAIPHPTTTCSPEPTLKSGMTGFCPGALAFTD